jgi:hypothetical protein
MIRQHQADHQPAALQPQIAGPARAPVSGWSVPDPDLELFGHRLSAFQICGVAGFAAAAALACLLAIAAGRSLPVVAALIASAALTFFGVTLLTRLISGGDELTHYHYLFALLVSSTLLLRLIGAPLLVYLDLAALGFGTTIAIGRLGCLTAGCCHGRPSRWGLCYGPAHIDNGLESYLAGARLFPIQLVEAAAAATLVAAGAAMILLGRPAGTALACYLSGYACVRLVLEFARGDQQRPFWMGLSEAQWTSLLLLAVVAVLGAGGVLPLEGWQVAAVSAAALALLTAMLIVRRTAWGRLLHARHIHEIANALYAPASDLEAIRVVTTSLGLRLSCSAVVGTSGPAMHYAISSQREHLRYADAARIADLIINIRHPGRPYQILPSTQRVYHIIVNDTQAPARHE